MDALYNAPGFRLVRRQVGQLVAYAKGEWKRLRPTNGPQIRTRSYLPYVQRLPNQKARGQPVPEPDWAFKAAGLALRVQMGLEEDGNVDTEVAGSEAGPDLLPELGEDGAVDWVDEED